MGLKYNIYLDGKFIKETTSLSAIVDGLEVETEYSVAVSETDGGKESKQTSPIKFKTLPNPNILTNSTWNLGQGDWNNGFNGRFEILNPESDIPDAHILHGLPLTVTTQQVSHAIHPIEVKTGEVLTVSFDYRDKNWTKNTNLIIVRIFPENNTPNAQSNALQQVRFGSDTEDIQGVESWTRFYKTFSVEKDGFLDILPYDSDDTGNHEAWWRRLKIEKGERSTSWIPAESDLS